jgi:hypothetical protein
VVCRSSHGTAFNIDELELLSDSLRFTSVCMS